MADVDFATCEQPDELIQLAWNAGVDKKAVIREATDAAMLLLAGERSDIIALFWPVPHPLEGVARWSENSSTVAGTSGALRPFASAVVPGCAVGYFVTRWLVAPHLAEDDGLTVMPWIIVASIVMLGLALKLLIDAAVRRRVARLDEDRALRLVLEQLRKGMVVCPALVPRAVTWIRRGLATVSAVRTSSL